MNSGRSRMVAALLPTLDNAIYARVVDGLENRLSAHNLSLVVAQTGDDQDVTLARAQKLVEIGAEGFIVAGVTHSQAFHELLDYAQIPIVAVSYYDPTNSIPTVGYDNWAAAILAAEHLRDLGHRNIAVVHGPLDKNDRTRRRHEALATSSFAHQLTFFEAEITVEGGVLATDRLLAQPSDVTAILCFSDILAMGALNRLHQRGHRVPEDFSVLGIENLPSSQFTFPALTSVRLHVEKMGETAADALVQWLETQKRPDHIELEVELIARASTAPV